MSRWLAVAVMLLAAVVGGLAQSSAAPDQSTFTQGTSNQAVIGGYFNNSPSNLGSGQAGAISLTADRSMFTNVNRVGGSLLSLFATPFTNIAATGTATSAAVRVPGFSSNGTLWITGSSITGAPVGCQIVIEQQGAPGGPASAAIVTQAFTPGNSYQSFNAAPALASVSSDMIVFVYTCGTYPTGGTISAGFSPIPGVALEGSIPAGSNNIGGVNPLTSTSNTQATSFASASALTTAVVVKASAGNIFGFYVTNGAASVCYLQFMNTAAGPSLGTNAMFSFALAANASLLVPVGTYAFASPNVGISVGISTTYNGNTACGTAGTAVIFYK